MVVFLHIEPGTEVIVAGYKVTQFPDSSKRLEHKEEDMVVQKLLRPKATSVLSANRRSPKDVLNAERLCLAVRVGNSRSEVSGDYPQFTGPSANPHTDGKIMFDIKFQVLMAD